MDHLFDGFIISTEDDREEEEVNDSHWFVPDLDFYAEEGVVLDELHALEVVPEDVFCHSLRAADSREADLDHVEELFLADFAEFVEVEVVYHEFCYYRFISYPVSSLIDLFELPKLDLVDIIHSCSIH